MDQPESESSIYRRSLRRRTKEQGNERKNDDLNFIEDFKPDQSNREKRKLKRRAPPGPKNTPYDEHGRIRHSGRDICDCMITECPGCWLECESCGSTRCGPNCRVNRRYYYESITYDGKDNTILNKHFPPKDDKTRNK